MSRVNPLKKLLPIQILAIGAFVLSLTASLFNIFADNSLIYPNFSSTFKMSITVVNIFTTLISLIIFFFPKLHFLLYIGLISQSIFCVMLGYIGLGVFLFTLFIILFYILTSFTEKTQKICLTLFFIAYSFVLFFIIPYGIERFFMALSTIFFIATAFICVVRLFKTKLKSLIPIINQELYISPEITLPKAGEKLNINSFDLSEREKSLLFDIMNNNKTYGELALNHSLSTSLVKKEMGKILDYFGCRNMESLKIVFSQFDIVVE